MSLVVGLAPNMSLVKKKNLTCQKTFFLIFLREHVLLILGYN